MPIIVRDYISPQMVRDNPDWIFVFGDNMERRGKGGQAIIRDFDNTVGIRTKWAPHRGNSAYFTDSDFDIAVEAINIDILAIHSHLLFNKTVVFPLAGVGTGRAELATRAPKIYEFLNEQLARILLIWEFNEST